MQANRIHVIAALSIQDQHADRAVAILRGLAETARTAAGNLRFEVLQHGATPARVATLETWADADAADAHMGSAYVAAALAELGPILAGPPAIERYVARA